MLNSVTVVAQLYKNGVMWINEDANIDELGVAVHTALSMVPAPPVLHDWTDIHKMRRYLLQLMKIIHLARRRGR
jgi:hypothetical protein